MNKICFLILAHTNPRQLKRLIDALSFDLFDIYVHIDKKSNITEFLHPKANFIDERVSVSWGGFSMVQATLNLVSYAYDGGKYQYYCLLSGTDYPIKSNKDIFNYITQDGNFEYLDFFKSDDSKWHDRYKKYYYYECYPIKRILDVGVRKILPDRRFPAGYAPHWGSSWWTLSNYAIEYILNVLNSDPSLVSFFRYCSSPDEMMFQTILCNSSFFEKIQKEFRYLDWSKGGSHPKTLIYSEDFESLKVSASLFARKFNNGDDAFLDAIDSELRQ
ncbi:beta-1,6-N-acetylglucosaminyltransferase [Methylomonas sp. BW4-1]|uniref:beta-1,6-N-acetylglucosaminyltransferase n=1 Tax=Methylomonas sp. BW4-1 TaxID=3376685 RepID=UPI004041F708